MMPFITKEDRAETEKTGIWKTVGHLCFLKYLPLIRAWKKERRWTTAHYLTRELFDIDNEKAAKLLAWFVFMVDEVMKYEEEKKKENGEIE